MNILGRYSNGNCEIGRHFCLTLILLIPFLLPFSASAQEKMVVGWIENVRIYPGELLIRAKLDTGAKTCSLNAPNLTEFRRDGKTWVRFEVKNKRGENVIVEEKVHRIASIKRHGGPIQRRLVIRIGICLGTTYKEVEVSLVDRSDFLYPLLIGRNFLSGNIVVDPSAKFTRQPSCKETLQP